ncbi:MAG: polysaccharide biosynthesis tyrosine autokinase [Clostridia bacterium]|nr:polysaccharide biosynthesis tyrosine autokinase [Clostridia bacterium]
MDNNENKLSFTIEWHCILKDLMKNILLIILAGLIGLMGTYIWAHKVYVPEYTSKCTLIVSARSGSYTTYNNLTASKEMAAVLSKVLCQPTVKEFTAKYLGNEEFTGSIQAEVWENTNIVYVSVTAGTPALAYQQLSGALAVYPAVSETIFNNGVVDIMQYPAIPKAPSNAISYIHNAVLVACICAVLMALVIILLSVLRDTVKDEVSYHEKIGQKLIGSVHHEAKNLSLKELFQKKKISLLVSSPSASFSFIENFQKIATKLEYMQRNQNMKVFMVTSVAENEGKSTIVSNIALSLAERGYKVLLMDMDFRKPALHKIFELQIAPETELGALLSGKVSMKEYRFLQYQKSSMYMALNARKYPDCTEWLSSEMPEQIISIFRKTFDFVIIDTPPMYAAADVDTITSLADGTLMVVRTDVSMTADINDSILTIQENKGKCIGCILNDVYPEFTLFGQTGADETGYYRKYSDYRYGRYGKYGKYGKYGNYIQNYNKE